MMSSSFAKHCQVTASAQVAAAAGAATGAAALLCGALLSVYETREDHCDVVRRCYLIGFIRVLILLLHAFPSFLELCRADLLQSAGEHELVCVSMHG